MSFRFLFFFFFVFYSFCFSVKTASPASLAGYHHFCIGYLSERLTSPIRPYSFLDFPTSEFAPTMENQKRFRSNQARIANMLVESFKDSSFKTARARLAFAAKLYPNEEVNSLTLRDDPLGIYHSYTEISSPEKTPPKGHLHQKIIEFLETKNFSRSDVHGNAISYLVDGFLFSEKILDKVEETQVLLEGFKDLDSSQPDTITLRYKLKGDKTYYYTWIHPAYGISRKLNEITNILDQAKEFESYDKKMEAFIRASYLYYRVMPFSRGSAGVGNGFFASEYYLLFKNKLRFIDGVDRYAMSSSFEEFKKWYLSQLL